MGGEAPEVGVSLPQEIDGRHRLVSMAGPVDPAEIMTSAGTAAPGAGEHDPEWIPEAEGAADVVIKRWTQRKIDALLRERGLDDEVETTRRFVIETIPEYADRFLLELLQNGHDALPVEGHGRICIELNLDAMPHGELLVGNTGTPFRYRDFRSLCRMAQSEKRPGEGIGHKGVGFKSVLQVAPQPEVYSAAVDRAQDAFHGFCFTFPDQARYRELLEDAGDDVPRMTPYSLPVPLVVAQQPASVRRLAASGYSTVIRLPLGPLATPTARLAVQDILSSSAPVLLFLHRIGELAVSIQHEGTSQKHRLTRTATQVVTGNLAKVEEIDLAEAGRFLMATGSADGSMFEKAIREDVAARRTSERWLEWTGQPEVSVAIPLQPGTDDRLYCYLPMQDSAHSPVAGHVNGPFAIGLARKELIPGSRINEVLLNAAADISVDAATELRVHPEFRRTVVDLIAWPHDGIRVVEALRRRGEDPKLVAILPVLGDRDWASFAEARCWDPEGTTQLTSTAVAGLVDDALVDPAIGRERLDAIVRFGSENLDLALKPPPEQVAGWTEAVARQLHRREKGISPPAAAWIDFYDDLPRAFLGETGRALAGRRILLGEEKELLETWSDADSPQTRGKIRRAVFFARTALEDPDADATDDSSVPGSLRRVLTRVHPDLDWFVPGEGRRNRPGRVFLEQHDLVRIPRIQDLLRLVERVLHRSRSTQVWRDALLFVYRLTRPGSRRPDLRTLGLERLGLRVPAGGGWVPSQEALFSRGWTERGARLSDLVESASAASTEVAGLGDRLLDPQESWIPKRTDPEGWIELLRYCGVADGLRPIALELSSSSVKPGWWWQDKNRIADTYGINEVDRVSWINALDFGSWPRHPGAEYEALGSPVRIPGQSDFDRFPENAKSAFAHLILAGLADWEESELSFAVLRRRGQGDLQPIPSPANAFLRSARWLRVRRPGGGGEYDWVAPSEVWLILATEHDPFFAPILDGRFRSDIVRSDRAQKRLVEFGAHFWSEREHAVARLLLLGRLLHDGRVLPGLVAQVRNAVEETWRTLVEEDPPLQLGDLKDASLVVARSEQLDTLPGAGVEPYFVLGAADKMLELVLVSVGKPVLVAKGDIGRKVWAQLQTSGAAAARLILPPDLVVEVDGSPVADFLEGAEPLVSADRRWLSDLVALTLELKPTAFRPPSPGVVQKALQRLLEIRLIAGGDVALQLDGQRLEVPPHLRLVVPADIDGTLAIVWVPEHDALTWRGLRRLAPAIADLINERGLRDALENVLHALGEGDGLVEEPTDERFAGVFGVPVVRIRELRQSHRAVVSQVLFRLVPLIACILGQEDANRVRTRTTEAADPEQGLEEALQLLSDRLPSGVTIEKLREAGQRSLGEARVELGIAFGEMNRALLQLGPPYSPETHPDRHAMVVSAFLAKRRDLIMDALRVRAIADGLESPGALDRYGVAVTTLDEAARRARMPDAADLLAPNPIWLMDYLEPPDHLLEDRVTGWLALHGAPSLLGAGSGLSSALSLRAANGQMLSRLLPRLALVIGAWIGRHGVSAAPGWTTDPDALIHDLAASGQLDFDQLDEDGVINLLAARQAWPFEMARTMDLVQLHLTDQDLRARQNEDERRRAVEERAKRGVEVAGRVVTLDSATVDDSVAHILSTIEDASLEVPTREVTLGAAPLSGGKDRAPGGGVGNKAEGAKGRVPKEKLETIGLIGEIVAWAWLSHHYGEQNVLWRSRNRAFKFHDGDPGDDSCGFDFEILHGRSRLFYEVKASTSDPREFELTEAEVRFALSKARTATYRVLYIGNVNAPAERVILPLPNPLAARSQDHYRKLPSGIKYAFVATSERT